MPDDFHTLTSELRGEMERIKGSRFTATVAPASTPEEAEAFVDRIRTEFEGATHNCWAYHLGGKAARFRSSDDGEPGGSAGRPILQQIEGHGLTDTVVVVTRWFGGTKLGVGGLMRAYGGAAGHALDRAGRRVVVITRRVAIEFPYEYSGAVEGVLAASGLTAVESDYAESVRQVFEVPERELETFSRELRDRTGGRVEVQEMKPAE